MSALVFVDTNVLVYEHDMGARDKQAKAQRWTTHLWESGTGRLSFQVLNEFYVTTTQKLKPGLTPGAARELVEALDAWHPVPTDRQLLTAAWSIAERTPLAWWDALIVAGAQLADCAFLLSEDMPNDQVIGGIRIVNPFLHDPEGVTA